MGVGGIAGAAVDTAAQLCALGINPTRFLETEDEFERSLILEIGKRTAGYRKAMDHSLAIDIANQVGKLFKR